MVLCPVICDQCSLAEHRQERSTVQRSSPDPVPSDLAVSLNQIAVPEKLTANVEDDRMVSSIQNPPRECLDLEELIPLPQGV